MQSRSLHRRVRWLPPFLVAGAGAAAGEMAAGLLLYSSEGFLRALTVVLVAEMIALGAGFLYSRRGEPADVDALRRRWLLAVFAFAGAAVFAGLWSLSGGSPVPGLRQGLVQGLGLGLLAALPLFATGVVLGALARPPAGVSESVGGSDDGGIAAPAFFGAAGGLLFTGLFGVPTLQPASLYLFCVVSVSGGALLHGWMVDRKIRVLSLEDRGGGGPSRKDGDDRWERRVRTMPSAEIRVLYVDGEMADAGAVSGGDGAAPRLECCVPWQRHVLDVVREESGKRWESPRILLLGIGTGALLSELESRGPRQLVVLDTGVPGRMPRPSVDATAVESWEAVADIAPPDGFDVVIVHLRLIPRDRPFGSFDVEFLRRALSFRSAMGVALFGGMKLDDEGVAGRTSDWISSQCGTPASVFRPGAGTWTWDAEPWDDLVASLGDRGGALVACRPDDGGDPSDGLGDGASVEARTGDAPPGSDSPVERTS